MNVLIIEDNLILRRAMGYTLLEAGNNVSAVSNGQEALDMIATNQNIDLIICDVMLPVMSGPSFLLQIKTYFQKKLPKIIIISSIKDGEDFLKKIEVKYDYFLQKPFEFTDFDHVIDKIKASEK